MQEFGDRNTSHGLAANGIEVAAAYYNDVEAALVERSLRAGEAKLAPGGALLAETGQHTGRSPKDKFTVRDATTEDAVDWGNNKPMDPAHFAALKADMLSYLKDKTVHVQDLACGADPGHRIRVRFVNELAWHMLFIRNMMRRPARSELASFVNDWTVINCPGFKADPARHGCRSETVISVSFSEKTVLIGSTSYAGENKKSIFGVMNFVLPEKGIMPMHCSANHATGDESESAVFFGLSGTGKTTLSADPDRLLIGDDEHVWSDTGVSNFEDGCYAKLIDLDKKNEPVIAAAMSMKGTLIENVPPLIGKRIEETDPQDFDLTDGTITENTRFAYPLTCNPGVAEGAKGPHPETIVLLTADAFGVLPPVSILDTEEVMYHFVMGFTSKLAGTEVGITEPQAAFSACFGDPFMSQKPSVYADLLSKRMSEHDTRCILLNTGWSGGAYGKGERMSLKVTRALLNAALNGELDDAETEIQEQMGLRIPVAVEGVDSNILNPRNTWDDPEAYDEAAATLKGLFQKTFEDKGFAELGITARI